MNHSEFIQQQREMAGAIQQGYSLEKVCSHFKRNKETIRLACVKYRVVFPRKVPPGAKKDRVVYVIRIVAALLKDNPCPSDIGREFNVSRQYVHQIKKQMVKAGLL